MTHLFSFNQVLGSYFTPWTLKMEPPNTLPLFYLLPNWFYFHFRMNKGKTSQWFTIKKKKKTCQWFWDPICRHKHIGYYAYFLKWVSQTRNLNGEKDKQAMRIVCSTILFPFPTSLDRLSLTITLRMLCSYKPHATILILMILFPWRQHIERRKEWLQMLKGIFFFFFETVMLKGIS